MLRLVWYSQYSDILDSADYDDIRDLFKNINYSDKILNWYSAAKKNDIMVLSDYMILMYL
jgi:hypothetical protein